MLSDGPGRGVGGPRAGGGGLEEVNSVFDGGGVRRSLRCSFAIPRPCLLPYRGQLRRAPSICVRKEARACASARRCLLPPGRRSTARRRVSPPRLVAKAKHSASTLVRTSQQHRHRLRRRHSDHGRVGRRVSHHLAQHPLVVVSSNNAPHLGARWARWPLAPPAPTQLRPSSLHRHRRPAQPAHV